jgi:hypothetical protein
MLVAPTDRFLFDPVALVLQQKLTLYPGRSR